jgi:hypothetical protein
MRASVTFSWLHVTDLHQGQRELDLLLPRVQTAFERDLRELHDQAGPFDLVLFTGDLTQRGAAEEFAALDRTLLAIWNCLESLGSHPVLLTVPGNHDLARPPAGDPRLGELARWSAEPATAQRFWAEPASPPRAVVTEAFANYTRWWNDHRFPRVPGHRTGTLPGEFTAAMEKRGFVLGVMGLNSAFLQLSEGDYTGKLDVGLHQFHAAAGGNASRWAEDCHAALLLTHHPVSWLAPDARQTFSDEIAGHFMAHLFGHMHEPELAQQRLLGSASGYRWLQGRSLFGLEHWGPRRARSHGYSVGRLTVADDRATLQIWPRLLVNQKMVPDHAAADLHRTRHCATETVALRQPFVHRSPAARRGEALPGPDAPFDRHWYVHRSDWEARALGYLDVLGKPATILGPKDIGKTWLCKYVCDLVRTRVSDPARVAEVDVGSLVARTGASTTESFLRELCLRVAAEIRLDRAAVDERWRQTDGAPGERATAVFEALLLPASPTPLVVAIDRLEAIPAAVRKDLFGLLRSWCDCKAQPPWDQLRLLLVVPRIPNLGDLQSPFTITQAIPVEAFSLEEAEELVSYYGVRSTARELTSAHRKLGGHPLWLRKAAYEAKARPASLAEVVDDLVAVIADDYRQRIDRKAPWRDALARIARGKPAGVKPATLDELYDAGFIVRKESSPLSYEPRMKEPLRAALES